MGVATHWLVAGTSAAEIERRTGLKAYDTPMGTLVEMQEPFDLQAALDQLNRITRPTDSRCTCGKHAVLHGPRCPLAYAIT